jgi:uncharacterized membrane protein
MDPRTRAFAKATTYRLLGTAVTVSCAWLLTGKATCAASIGVLDTVLKLGGYYVHERLWDRAGSGKSRVPFRRSPFGSNVQET